MDTTLVILAAGLGTRFGGGSEKQLAAVGKHDEIMSDFSVYDAILGGFTKIVYVIKPDMEPMFTENIASKIKGAKTFTAFQRIDDLPQGFSVPQGREKPWGTAHAMWAARHKVKEPFMVINADDYYGRSIYKAMNSFLRDEKKGNYDYAMGGYFLGNTVSEYGSVSRGICTLKNGFLEDVKEVKGIEKRPEGIGYIQDDVFHILPDDTPVSMNSFAFKPSIFTEFERVFTQFLADNSQNLTAECGMADIAKELIQRGAATMSVLPATDRWYGFTYKAEQEIVRKAIWSMIDQGIYPEKLF